MPKLNDVAILRADKLPTGKTLTPTQREKIIKPYLPSSRPSPQRKPSPRLVKTVTAPGRVSVLIHRLLFFLIQTIFSIYIRLRQTYRLIADRLLAILYYHHRTPELIQRDIKNLKRLPKHLSILLELKSDNTNRIAEDEALSLLIDDVAEMSVWCACVGIPMVSIYERTGILKTQMPALHRAVDRNLRSYFAASHVPSFGVRAPNMSSYEPAASANGSPERNGNGSAMRQKTNLDVLLLSASDGRATLVDLTKTLAEMSQRGKLDSADISAELIDAEIAESSCGEPDLLIVMAPSTYRTLPERRKRRRSRSSSRGKDETGEDESGRGIANGDLCLRGYPPWQVRLTEIFYVKDNVGVGYHVFLQALHRYAKAQMRFGH